MGNGLTRLQSRFLREPARVARVLEHVGSFDTKAALEAGFVTFAPDDIDWEDEIRIAFEERASMSPDGDRPGMEASLRFAGPETMETKIFGRLTAWQNWIFQRPNAVGPAAPSPSTFGKPERAEFDFKQDVESHVRRRQQRTNPQQRPALGRQPPPARARGLAAEQPPVVAGDGPERASRRTIDISRDGDQRRLRHGWANFDYVKMPRLPVGDLSRRAGEGPHDRLRRRLRQAGLAAGTG